MVVRIDLVVLFRQRHRPRRVYGLLRMAGYPEPVAHTLAAHLHHPDPGRAYCVPPPRPDLSDRAYRLAAVAGTPPAAGRADARPRWRTCVRTGSTGGWPGWPSVRRSPITRYADDLAFSGDLPPRRVAELLRRGDASVTGSEGFRVHSAQDSGSVAGPTGSCLAGLVVNERAGGAARASTTVLRAILHNAARTGLAAQNHAGHPAFAEHLIGRVAWLSHAHPTRSAKLARLLTAALAGPVPRSDLPRE